MVVAIHPDEIWTYVLNADREEYAEACANGGAPEREPTEFTFRSILSKDKAKIDDCMTRATRTGRGQDDFSMAVHAGSQTYSIVELGLVSWERFFHRDSTEAQFKTRVEVNSVRNRINVPTKETMALIPSDVMRELADAIMDRTTLSMDELKNSISSS